MQDNANSESFRSVLLPTHKHKAKICQLEQDCLTQRFSFPFCLCAPLARGLFLCAGETSECKGNHIWEIMPLLMYNTTKTSPSNKTSVLIELFLLDISQRCTKFCLAECQPPGKYHRDH